MATSLKEMKAIVATERFRWWLHNIVDERATVTVKVPQNRLWTNDYYNDMKAMKMDAQNDVLHA